MASLTFGIHYNDLAMSRTAEPVDFSVRAEDWGYRSCFFEDVAVSPSLDPIVVIAAAAQRTKQLRLGTGVLILPFRPAYQLAKTALSLSQVANGRIILGLGTGIFKDDFEVMGADMHLRGAVTDERLGQLARLLRGETISADASHPASAGAALVRPLLDPTTPPIWTGATWNGRFAAKPIRRAAMWADGFYPHETPAYAYRDVIREIEDTREAMQLGHRAMEWATMLWMRMGTSKASALLQAQAGLNERYGDNAWKVEPNNGYLLGSDAEIVDKIGEYVDAGVTHVVVNSLASGDHAIDEYRRFASNILPRFSSFSVG